MESYDFPVGTYEGTPFIVAMGGDQDTSYDDDNDIYITSASDHVVFRWKAQEHGAEGEGTDLNFEIVLYSDGNFELNYGNNTISGEEEVYVGMSDGISKSTLSAYNEISDYNQLQTSFWGEVVEDTEEEEDDAEKAKIDSWKASMITDKSSCPEKLQLEIKGHKFDNDAIVKIGSREASWVDVKSSQKIVARFCMEKLLKAKLSSKRDIRVANPDADSAKAKKKIDLNNVVGAIDEGMFNQGMREGVLNIQKALVKLGYLGKENITGAYGPLTTEAVKKFQGDNGISQTGNVGPLTQAALQKKLK